MNLEEVIKKMNTVEFKKDWKQGINLSTLKKKYKIESNDDVVELRKLFSLKTLVIRMEAYETLDLKKYVNLFEKGFTYEEIQKELGIGTREHARIIREELGLEKRSGGLTLDEEIWRERERKIRELDALDKTDSEIAKELGTTNYNIQNWRSRFGISNRKRISKKEEIGNILSKRGAITTLELEENYNVDLKIVGKENFISIEEKITSYGYECIEFDLLINEFQGYKPIEFFGDHNRQFLIFLPGIHKGVILEFFKILRKSKWYENYFESRDKKCRTSAQNRDSSPIIDKIMMQEFLLGLLNSMKNVDVVKEDAELLTTYLVDTGGSWESKRRSRELNGLWVYSGGDIWTQNLRNEFIRKIRKKYDFLISSLENEIKIEIEGMEKNDLAENNQKVLEKQDYGTLPSPKLEKFFGRKFNAKQYFEELLDDKMEEKIKKLVQIFRGSGYSIKESDDDVIDFTIIGEKREEYFVKVVDENFLNMDIFDFDERFGQKGILISFENDVRIKENRITGKINITNKKLEEIILGLKYLPVQEKTLAKVMYGEHYSEIVFVENIFDNTKVQNIINKKKFSVELSTLKEIKNAKLILERLEEFISLITYLNEIGDFDILEEVEKEINFEIFNGVRGNEHWNGTERESDWKLEIEGNVDGRQISINVDNLKLYEDEQLEFDRVFDEMINCSGPHWGEIMSKRKICNHMGIILYNTWIQKSLPDNITRKCETYIIGRKEEPLIVQSSTLRILRELYFRLKLIPDRNLENVEKILMGNEIDRSSLNRS